VLVYDQVEIIRKSLEFLSLYADALEIVVIENPSENSYQIKELVDLLGRQKLIARHYLFDENITGNAYGIVLDAELKRIRKCQYVVLTDGDLTSNHSDWLHEEVGIMKKHKEVFACGISLEMTNLPLATYPEAIDWIPPDIAIEKDFYEAYTGGHLLIFRSKELISFMVWRTLNKLSFVDGEMHRYCYEILGKKWARTKISRAYHHTWDLYADKKHPYTQRRANKSFSETWYHTKVSKYTCTLY
jgi:hypothetical protein